MIRLRKRSLQRLHPAEQGFEFHPDHKAPGGRIRARSRKLRTASHGPQGFLTRKACQNGRLSRQQRQDDHIPVARLPECASDASERLFRATQGLRGPTPRKRVFEHVQGRPHAAHRYAGLMDDFRIAPPRRILHVPRGRAQGTHPLAEQRSDQGFDARASA